MDDFLYRKNIENMKYFFNSEKFKKFVEAHNREKDINKKIDIINEIKNIINTWYIDNGEFKPEENKNAIEIYKDPDDKDKKLYTRILNSYKLKNYETNGCMYKNEGFFLKLDGVIGWKAIINILYLKNRKIEDIKKVVDIYEVIRCVDENEPKSEITEYMGHLIWPVSGLHLTTINQKRYNKFRDRVDYTLFDIKKFMEAKSQVEKEKCKLIDVYKYEFNKNWLNKFKDFKDFLEKMNFKRWCKEEDGEIKIIDLSQNIENIRNNSNLKFIEKYIDEVKDEEEYDIPENIEIRRLWEERNDEVKRLWNGKEDSIYNYANTTEYLNNLIYIVSNGKANQEVYIK